MKTINIAHLYYDLMNLYGENGNMRILLKHLEDQKVEVKLSFLTIGDEIDFNTYDLVYMGTGSEINQKLVLQDLMKYKSEVKSAIDSNKFFLVTGNSIELFGNHIIDLKENKIDCLACFDFYTKETEFRIVGEQVYESALITQPIVGFQNRSGAMFDIENGPFKVKSGTGFKPKSEYEGIISNNFIATYLIGPILVRNPYFTEYLVKQLLDSNNIAYKKCLQGTEYKAYEAFLSNFNEMVK